MSFEDLPEKWDHLPLTDPRLAADVVDLFLSNSDRLEDSLLILMLDDAHRLLQPAVMGGVPWRCTTLERQRTLESLADLPVPAMLLAFSSPYPLPADVLWRWRRDVARLCADGGPEVTEVFAVTPSSVVRCPGAAPPAVAS
ncbi:MAG: hypothetical protein GX596_14075 [Propionibacterium sp.]|nr:hypothetical protein [Propionibacterium sp.]